MKGKSNKCNIKSKKKKQSKLAFVGNNKKIVYLSSEKGWGGATSLVKLCSELMSHWEPRGSGLQRHNDKCNTSRPICSHIHRNRQRSSPFACRCPLLSHS